jgi:hypothetical protein
MEELLGPPASSRTLDLFDPGPIEPVGHDIQRNPQIAFDYDYLTDYNDKED